MKKFISGLVAAGAIALGGCAQVEKFVKEVVVPGLKTAQEIADEIDRRKQQFDSIKKTYNDLKKKVDDAQSNKRRRPPYRGPADASVKIYGRDENWINSQWPPWASDGLEFEDSDSLDKRISKVKHQIYATYLESGIYLTADDAVAHHVLGKAALAIRGGGLSRNKGHSAWHEGEFSDIFDIVDGGAFDSPRIASFTDHPDDTILVSRDLVQLAQVVGISYAKFKHCPAGQTYSRSDFERDVQEAFKSLLGDEDSSLSDISDNHNPDNAQYADNLTHIINYSVACLTGALSTEVVRVKENVFETYVQFLGSEQNEHSKAVLRSIELGADSGVVKLLCSKELSHTDDVKLNVTGLLLFMEVLRAADAIGVYSGGVPVQERYDAVRAKLASLGYESDLWK